VTTSRRSLIALLAAALVAASAAPAEARTPRPPTRLWYSAKVTYKYDGVYDETRPGQMGGVHEVSNVEWGVHTQRGEAPLVRRNRETGEIEFAIVSGAQGVGRIKRVDWSRTVSWDPTVNNALKTCSPPSYTVRSHLTTNPEINGLVQVGDGSFNTQLVAAPHSRTAEETGTITCTGQCPFALPGSGRAPIDDPGGGCHFDPGPPVDGNAQWEFPYRNDIAIPNQLRPQHEHNFRVRRGFGNRRLRVSSTADALYEGTLVTPDRNTRETATETITIDFTRCPHAGRRPC
jgi:hypothetical protein